MEHLVRISVLGEENENVRAMPGLRLEENKPYLYAWSINLGKFRIDKIKSRENMKSALSDFHVQFCSMSSSSNWQFGGTLDRLVSILILFVTPVPYVPLWLGRGYINANNLGKSILISRFISSLFESRVLPVLRGSHRRPRHTIYLIESISASDEMAFIVSS